MDQRGVVAGRTPQGEAVRIPGTSAQFSRLREVTQAYDHTGGDGASLDTAGASWAHLDACGAEDSMGRCAGEDSERCERKRTANAAVSCSVAVPGMREGSVTAASTIHPPRDLHRGCC